MQEVIIRKAEEKDRSQIAAAITTCYEKEFKTLSKDLNKINLLLEPGIQINRFYIAEVEKKIIGITACSDCNGRSVHIYKKSCRNSFGLIKGTMVILFFVNECTRSLPYLENTGYIEFVGVIPEYQGNGIAGKIIEYIITSTIYNEFILDVTDVNIPAQKCYEHIGFKEYDRIKERGGKIKGFKERIFMKYVK